MIYIDVARLLRWEGTYTGMERFAFEVSKELMTLAPEEVRFCCFIPSKGFVALEDSYQFAANRLVSSVIGPAPSLRQLMKSDKKAFLYHYIQRQRTEAKQRRLQPIALSKKDTLLIYDGLWDQSSYIQAVLAASEAGARIAHAVCDLIPLVMPQVCLDFVTEAMQNYFNLVMPRIDVLLSISRNTQADVERLYRGKLKPDIKKQVLRFGDRIGEINETDEPVTLKLQPGEFLLTVGTIEIRKNHQLLYQAYRLAAAQKLDLPKLVIVGRQGWMSESVVHELTTDPLVKDQVVFAGPVKDSELNWLYAHCSFTVFPSLYEGWGLPVAESLYHGKVCAASATSSVPEIGGDLNEYFSPYDAGDCLGVLQELLKPAVRRKHEAAIKEYYQPVLWRQTAQELLDTIKG